MLEKIISGGQTGADQAGLDAAALFGIETGGWCPRGFKTEKGCDLRLKKFGLVETDSPLYPPRTFANARDSDGTIRFAQDFTTRGEICTLNGIKKFNKPHIDVDMGSPRPVVEVVEWIMANNIKTLNVAGNRESTNPGIHDFSVDYLSQVLKELGHESLGAK